jgi:hypothetical protein
VSIVKPLLSGRALVNAGVAGLKVASTLSLAAIVASTSVARTGGSPAGGVGNAGAPGGNGIVQQGQDAGGAEAWKIQEFILSQYI